MSRFYSRLSYSLGNEDWETEKSALNVRPNDRVFCVTASGDRPLHLLTTECSEVIAVDLNPTQNFLVALKLAAAVELEYESYIAFLGLTPSKHRQELFQLVLRSLDAEAATFWQSQRRMMEKGVLYQGRVERLCQKMVAPVVKTLMRSKIEQLFAFDDIEEQMNFVELKWDTPRLKRCFSLIVRPTLARPFIGDPGLYAYVDPDFHPGMYLYDRIKRYLSNHLAKESLLLSLIFTGSMAPEAYPLYLTEEGHQLIRCRADRLRWSTDNAVDFLERRPPGDINCFSLSDIASYMSAEDFSRMLAAIKQTAAPGARFCIRQFMSRHPFPAQFATFLQRDPHLERELEERDRCFVYDYTVGEVIIN